MIKMLGFAPVFMLLNGYWMLSNEQMFNNKWSWVPTDISMMKSDHTINFKDITYCYPIMIISLFSMILMTFKIFFNDKLMEWGFSSQSTEIEVDENLPAFLSTIKHDQGQVGIIH